MVWAVVGAIIIAFLWASWVTIKVDGLLRWAEAAHDNQAMLSKMVIRISKDQRNAKGGGHGN